MPVNNQESDIAKESKSPEQPVFSEQETNELIERMIAILEDPKDPVGALKEVIEGGDFQQIN